MDVVFNSGRERHADVAVDFAVEVGVANVDVVERQSVSGRNGNQNAWRVE